MVAKRGPKPNNPERELTLKQSRFVDAYLGKANGNATEACVLAGYDGDRKSLAVIGTNNLKKRIIRNAIEERTKDDGAISSRDERQQFLTAIMRGEHRKMPERMKAVEMLCRMHGDFIERHSVDMTVSRKDQQQEISDFLSRLSDRVVDPVVAIGPGQPAIRVIEAVSEAVEEAVNDTSRD